MKAQPYRLFPRFRDADSLYIREHKTQAVDIIIPTTLMGPLHTGDLGVRMRRRLCIYYYAILGCITITDCSPPSLVPAGDHHYIGLSSYYVHLFLLSPVLWTASGRARSTLSGTASAKVVSHVMSSLERITPTLNWLGHDRVLATILCVGLANRLVTALQ